MVTPTRVNGTTAPLASLLGALRPTMDTRGTLDRPPAPRPDDDPAHPPERSVEQARPGALDALGVREGRVRHVDRVGRDRQRADHGDEPDHA